MRDGTNSIAGRKAEPRIERLRAAVGWLGTPLTVAFLFALCFATDAWEPARSLLTSLTVALAIVAAIVFPWTWRAALLAGRAWWPYLAYAGAVSLSFALADSGASATAVADTLWMVLLVAATSVLTARASTRNIVIVTLLCGLAILLTAVLGPRSAPDMYGRAGRYAAMSQWGAYPEAGLLAMLGAAGTWAIASSARLVRVRAAAVVLTGGFVAVPFLVYSRSAVVAALAALTWTTIVAAIKWRDRLSFVVLGIGLFVTVLVPIVRPGEVARLREVLSREVGSVQVSDREQHWRAARAMIAAHPWVGVGPGRFPAEYAAYRTTLGVAGPPESITHAHNMLLHVAAETGLLALIPFCVIWLRTLVGTIRASASDDAGVSAFVVHSMLMAFFVRGLTDQFLTDVHSSFRTSMLIGLLLGMAEAIAASQEPRSLGARMTAWRGPDVKIASPETRSQGGA